MNSIHNLSQNLTKSQKIGICAVFVICILLIVLASLSLTAPSDNITENDAIEDNVTTATVALDKGTKYNNGDIGSADQTTVEVPASTDYNEDHIYLLTDYLPYDKYVLDYDGSGNSRMYFSIMENTAVDKGIVVSADSCGIEENIAAANEYLNSIPVDLSDYVIVYQTHTDEAPCNL